MAMGQQPHPMRATARNAGMHVVSFTSNGAAAPAAAAVVDDGGVISTTIAYTNPGVYVISLTDRWKRVRAVATCEDATNSVIAKVTGHVEGSAAANTITVQTESGAVAANTTAKVVSVIIYLSR